MLQMLDHVRDQHQIEISKSRQDLLRLPYVDLLVDVIPDRISILSESVDAHQLHLPAFPIDPLIPNVEVFPEQDSVLAEPTTNIEDRTRLQRLNGRQDRHDVVRITGRHMILLANSLLIYRFALACKFSRKPVFSRCFIPSAYK